VEGRRKAKSKRSSFAAQLVTTNNSGNAIVRFNRTETGEG